MVVTTDRDHLHRPLGVGQGYAVPRKGVAAHARGGPAHARDQVVLVRGAQNDPVTFREQLETAARSNLGADVLPAAGPGDDVSRLVAKRSEHGGHPAIGAVGRLQPQIADARPTLRQRGLNVGERRSRLGRDELADRPPDDLVRRPAEQILHRVRHPLDPARGRPPEDDVGRVLGQEPIGGRGFDRASRVGGVSAGGRRHCSRSPPLQPSGHLPDP